MKLTFCGATGTVTGSRYLVSGRGGDSGYIPRLAKDGFEGARRKLSFFSGARR